MTFKNSIYANKKLAEDLIDPETGEVLIHACRKLTMYLLERAENAGVKITEDMFVKSRSERKKITEAKKKADRIEFLKGRIPYLKSVIKAQEAELIALENSESQQPSQ